MKNAKKPQSTTSTEAPCTLSLREQRLTALRIGPMGKFHKAMGWIFCGEDEDAVLRWREEHLADDVDTRGEELFESGTAIIRRASRPPRHLN